MSRPDTSLSPDCLVVWDSRTLWQGAVSALREGANETSQTEGSKGREGILRYRTSINVKYLQGEGAQGISGIRLGINRCGVLRYGKSHTRERDMVVFLARRTE